MPTYLPCLRIFSAQEHIPFSILIDFACQNQLGKGWPHARWHLPLTPPSLSCTAKKPRLCAWDQQKGSYTLESSSEIRPLMNHCDTCRVRKLQWILAQGADDRFSLLPSLHLDSMQKVITFISQAYLSLLNKSIFVTWEEQKRKKHANS